MAGPNDETPGLAPGRPFENSLCWGCANHRVIGGARSVFLKCEALAVKYPRQPVTACPAFRAAVR
jgi:hypothetical protein